MMGKEKWDLISMDVAIISDGNNSVLGELFISYLLCLKFHRDIDEIFFRICFFKFVFAGSFFQFLFFSDSFFSVLFSWKELQFFFQIFQIFS